VEVKLFEMGKNVYGHFSYMVGENAFTGYARGKFDNPKQVENSE